MLFGNGVIGVGEVSDWACFRRAKIIVVSNERLIFGKPDLMVKRGHTDTFTSGTTLRASMFGFG